MTRYRYEGPVKQFGDCINRCWVAETIAISKERAMVNFKYRYKRDHNLSKDVKIELTGKIIAI